ncbi:hypothetical protein [Aliarcobacter butzleri]|uniref:hypothetical protein n=1 Tax=Aliarcobacter butzleri TaxID=28197 RepID=UPI0021B15B04|nr:hypothetical protein [Aliarcobacter butzleri]MCT7596121.1 hypothetical protein [Aliarcobacter butzleri]
MKYENRYKWCLKNTIFFSEYSDKKVVEKEEDKLHYLVVNQFFNLSLKISELEKELMEDFLCKIKNFEYVYNADLEYLKNLHAITLQNFKGQLRYVFVFNVEKEEFDSDSKTANLEKDKTANLNDKNVVFEEFKKVITVGKNDIDREIKIVLLNEIKKKFAVLRNLSKSLILISESI